MKVTKQITGCPTFAGNFKNKLKTLYTANFYLKF